MHKGEMNHKLDEDSIREFLQMSAEEEMVPQSLQPAGMKEWLKQQREIGRASCRERVFITV